MDFIGIAEVKRVAFGCERIILTSRGKPKAVLIGIEDQRKLERMERAEST
jgi:prevent-host-death family protein